MGHTLTLSDGEVADIYYDRITAPITFKDDKKYNYFIELECMNNRPLCGLLIRLKNIIEIIPCDKFVIIVHKDGTHKIEYKSKEDAIWTISEIGKSLNTELHYFPIFDKRSEIGHLVFKVAIGQEGSQDLKEMIPIYDIFNKSNNEIETKAS